MLSPGVKRAIRYVAAEFPPARWAARAAARLVAPKHRVGAVGVVFDDAGRVLLVEHAFRTDFPWGLPGGWVAPGEDPRMTVARELREELGLNVEVSELVMCATVGRVRTSTHPVHLGLGYYCRLLSPPDRLSMEVLAYDWIDPASGPHPLAPFQERAIERAARLHEAEMSRGRPS